jgi:dihydrofolate reductase
LLRTYRAGVESCGGGVRSIKKQYYTASTLDGFIASEEHSLDWLFALGDPVEPSYPAFIEQVGALAMGASTYEWLLRHLAEAASDAPAAWPYTQPAWVFTHRELPGLPGAAIEFVQGDVRPVHAAMAAAAGGKNLWVVGGGDLVGQFHDAGHLDEIVVQIASVTLGAGRPLLSRRLLPPVLELTSVRQMGAGFAELTYAVTRQG